MSEKIYVCGHQSPDSAACVIIDTVAGSKNLAVVCHVHDEKWDCEKTVFISAGMIIGREALKEYIGGGPEGLEVLIQ